MKSVFDTMTEATLIIQRKWRQFVHRAFVDSVRALKEEDVIQQKKRFSKFSDFRAYIFSDVVRQKHTLFAKHLRRFIFQLDSALDTKIKEHSEVLVASCEDISSAYLYVLFKNQTLTSLDQPQSELKIERELYDAAETFVHGWDSFIFHVVLKARNETTTFFYENEEHLLDRTSDLLLYLVDNFKIYREKYEAWKHQIQEMRIFGVENAVYTLQKLKSIYHSSSYNEVMTLQKESFFKNRFLESLSYFPMKTIVWKNMNEQTLKLQKEYLLFPEKFLPERDRMSYSEIRDDHCLTPEILLHKLLLDDGFRVPFVATADDMSFSHIFDDIFAELCFAKKMHQSKRQFSLLFLNRFLHQLQCDVAKLQTLNGFDDTQKCFEAGELFT